MSGRSLLHRLEQLAVILSDGQMASSSDDCLEAIEELQRLRSALEGQKRQYLDALYFLRSQGLDDEFDDYYERMLEKREKR